MQRVAKHIKFPKDLVDAVEKYQHDNFIGSFAAAVYELIRKGLDQ